MELDKVSIGNKNFTVEGIIDDYPDRNSSFVGFYPVAIVHINNVDAMVVIQTGSRFGYRTLFSVTQDQLESFEQLLATQRADQLFQHA